MHAAGVLGDVAADRAGDLRRRIGRVVQPVRRGRLGDREIAHARLHDGGARQRIDRQDALELRQRQDDALAVRHRAAGQAGAGAARDHGHARRMAELRRMRRPAPRSPAAARPAAARETASARRIRTARVSSAVASDSRRRKYVAKCGKQGWIEHRGTRPTGFDYSTNEAPALCSLYRATRLRHAARMPVSSIIRSCLEIAARPQRELKR